MRCASSFLLGIFAVGACSDGKPVQPGLADGGLPDAGLPDAAAPVPSPPMLTVALLDTPTYGTRLTAAPGTDASVLPGWRLFDRNRDSECRFITAADGQLRCLPTGNVLYFTPTDFSDPQCTKPVVVHRFPAELSCGRELLPILAIRNGDSCPTSYAMYRLGPRVSGRYFQLLGGVCRENSAETVHALGDPIAPTEFVAATRRIGEAHGGIAPVFLEVEDGSRLFRGWHLPGEATGCAFGAASDGKLRCLPPPAAGTQDYRQEYGDANCTMRAAVAFSGGCGASPQFVRSYVSGVCGEPRISVHRVLARSATLYERQAAGCVPKDRFGSTSEVLTFGPEIAPGELVEGQLAISGGDGRLKHLAVVTPAGAARIARFWDERLRTYCQPGRALDGNYRCLPVESVTSEFGGYFADSKCSQKLVLTYTGCSTAYGSANDLSSCDSRLHVFGLTPRPHDGPVYVQSGTCEAGRTLAEQNALAYDFREIPPEEFVAVDAR